MNRAVVELGNICKVRAEARNHPLTQPWELKHLQMQAASDESPYLGNNPRFIYLYQCGVATRGLFGVHFASLQQSHIVYTASTAQEDIMPLLNKIESMND